MIIRMLRAGAGTWPVARPKRADKIMRRIRPFLRMFGEKVEELSARVEDELLMGGHGRIPIPPRQICCRYRSYNGK